MQIKTTMKNYYKPITTAKIHNTENTTCWQGHGAKRITHTLLVRMKNGIASSEHNWVVSYNIKHTFI